MKAWKDALRTERVITSGYKLLPQIVENSRQEPLELFARSFEKRYVLVPCYVDDLLIMRKAGTTSTSWIWSLFKTSPDVQEAKVYLGMKIEQTFQLRSLCQKKNVDILMSEMERSNCSATRASSHTSVALNVKIQLDRDDSIPHMTFSMLHFQIALGR